MSTMIESDAVIGGLKVRELARPNILSLRAYSSARSLVSEDSVESGDVAFLDANELGDAFLAAGLYPPRNARINRYPEPQPSALIAALTNLYGVPPSQLCVGAGADAAIDAVIRIFCEPGKDAIVITPPTYGYYKVAAEIHGAGIKEVPLKGAHWSLDHDAIIRAVEAGGKVVFVCSPNNPTGHVFNRDEILSLAQKMAGRAILVVDEAYGEFSAEPSLASDVGQVPGLVVLRTLSKAWGMAGLRIGTAIADAALIGLMHKVRFPYPLSRLSTSAALAVLGDEPQRILRETVAKVRCEKERLAKALAQSPFVAAICPSETNFLLVKCADHRGFLTLAREARVIVRDRSQEPGLAAMVRVTVGSPAENDRLIAALGGGFG